jgi:hypothetical protein
MVMAFVPSLSTVGLGKLDPVAIDAIDSSNRRTVCANHLHMLFDAFGIDHHPCSG